MVLTLMCGEYALVAEHRALFLQGYFGNNKPNKPSQAVMRACRSCAYLDLTAILFSCVPCEECLNNEPVQQNKILYWGTNHCGGKWAHSVYIV